MQKRCNKISSAILVILIMFLFTSVSYAGKSSGKIDGVLIRMEDGIVGSITLNEYGKMYLSKKGDLYDFLKTRTGTGFNLKLYGVRSGEKYISLNEYGKSYIRNSRRMNSVLNDAKEIDDRTVSTFYNVQDNGNNIITTPITPEFDLKLEQIYIGDIKGDSEGNNIIVKIPKEISSEIIGNIQLNFNKDVKILEIGGAEPNADIINRFLSNGYDLNKYYNSYIIKTSWSYKKLVGIESSTSYTIITRNNETETFEIDLIIE